MKPKNVTFKPQNVGVACHAPQGITLIALIITVIVMLILAGVAISAINNVGLFDRITKATELYNNSVNTEEGTVNNWIGVLDNSTSSPKSTLMAVSSSGTDVLGNTALTRDKIETVTFANNITPPPSAIDSWDVGETKDGSVIAWYTDVDGNGLYELTIGGYGQVYANADSSYLFYNYKKLKTMDFTYFNTEKVTNMVAMFQSAGANATTFNPDLSKWDTSNVTTMLLMFNGAGNNATTFNLNLSKWDTSNVINMTNMFAGAGINATTWNIGDISSWNTSNVITMSRMFYQAGYNATTFNLDLSKWDTSKVSDMTQMFESTGYNATTFNLNLSNWNIGGAVIMNMMFIDTPKLQNLYINNWATPVALYKVKMFDSTNPNLKIHINSAFDQTFFQNTNLPTTAQIIVGS